jgi:hypothetical protein
MISQMIPDLWCQRQFVARARDVGEVRLQQAELVYGHPSSYPTPKSVHREIYHCQPDCLKMNNIDRALFTHRRELCSHRDIGTLGLCAETCSQALECTSCNPSQSTQVSVKSYNRPCEHI